jgi:hypothetical protein
MLKPVFFQKVVVFRPELAGVTPRFFPTFQNITITVYYTATFIPHNSCNLVQFAINVAYWRCFG